MNERSERGKFYRFVRSQCEKNTSFKEEKNPILTGLYAHSHNGRLKRPLISNVSISSINASERSDRASGRGALSHLKLGARLMFEGGTYLK